MVSVKIKVKMCSLNYESNFLTINNKCPSVYYIHALCPFILVSPNSGTFTQNIFKLVYFIQIFSRVILFISVSISSRLSLEISAMRKEEACNVLPAQTCLFSRIYLLVLSVRSCEAELSCNCSRPSSLLVEIQLLSK